MMMRFQKNDYVIFDYEGNSFNAKIIDVYPDSYLIEFCVDSCDNNKRLMQQLVVPERKIKPIELNIV